MIYYEHHLGDYAEATSHLSMLEDGAYSRLLRKYYATEKPLPMDIAVIQRLAGARTQEEKDAVEAVVKEFFELREDGWHNRRCDEEIARIYAKSAKARASAMARWGGATKAPSQLELVPSEDASMGSHNDGNANALRKQSERYALQDPIPNIQEEEEEKERYVEFPPDGGNHPSLAEMVRSVFDHWRLVWNHQKAKLSVKRQRLIAKRLQDGYTADDLRNAISGYRHSPWHMGTDPKGNGTVYDSIELFLRDAEHVERGQQLLAAGPQRPIVTKTDQRTQSNVDAITRGLGLDADPSFIPGGSPA